MMETRQQVETEYSVGANGFITSPGKFEGQPWWAPIAHARAMEGFADVSTGHGDEYRDALILGIDERTAWGLKDDTFAVVIEYSEQGFVAVYQLNEEDFDSAFGDEA